MNRNHTASIKDVAAYANVSISTVSNVLNNTKKVSKHLQDKVYEAVRVLNYQTNPIAKGLKSKVTNTISIIVPSISSIYFPQILRSIHNEAIKAGYSISIYETRQSIEREIEYIELLKSLWTDGLILSSSVNIDDPKSRSYLENLSSLSSNGKNIPVVCIESAISDKLDAVTADDREAICHATKYLISLGRKDIAYISAPTHFYMGKERMTGYIDALNSAGIPVREEYIIEGDYTPKSGHMCMQRLLARLDNIDGVVSGNDQMAIGAIRCIKDAGLRIPEDIAVIGFNDNFPSSLINPPLSSMRVPKEEMGAIAFDLLINRIKNPDAERKLVKLKSELIVRKSTEANGDDSWNLDW